MISARERLASTNLDYYPLLRLADACIGDPGRLPVTVKILLEGLLRGVERGQVSDVSLRALARWPEAAPAGVEVPYLPSRILLQDFTEMPAGSIPWSRWISSSTTRFRWMRSAPWLPTPGTSSASTRAMGSATRCCA